MKNLFISAILLSTCCAFLSGCTPAATDTEAATTSDQAVAQTGTCAACSAEVAKTELVSQGGQSLCKKCAGAH